MNKSDSKLQWFQDQRHKNSRSGAGGKAPARDPKEMDPLWVKWAGSEKTSVFPGFNDDSRSTNVEEDSIDATGGDIDEENTDNNEPEQLDYVYPVEGNATLVRCPDGVDSDGVFELVRCSLCSCCIVKAALPFHKMKTHKICPDIRQFISVMDAAVGPGWNKSPQDSAAATETESATEYLTDSDDSVGSDDSSDDEFYGDEEY